MIQRFPGLTADPQPRRRAWRARLHRRRVARPGSARHLRTDTAGACPYRREPGDGGHDKGRILSAIVYIADIARKEEMNRAWDEWVDRANPPMRACLGVDLEPPHLVEIVVTAAQ